MEKLLRKLNIRELKEYEITEYSKEAVCFIGTPFKNPQIQNKIIISPSFFNKSNRIFYEFNIKDIIKVEELDNITDSEGNSIPIIKIWIKKGAKGIKHEPFIVE